MSKNKQSCSDRRGLTIDSEFFVPVCVFELKSQVSGVGAELASRRRGNHRENDDAEPR